MVKMPDGRINLLIKFVHPYDTFYHEGKITFFKDKILSLNVLDTILSCKLEEVFNRVTATDLIMDSDGEDNVFITIVAPHWFPEESGDDAKIVSATVNYLTNLVWNKMKNVSDIILFEDYYLELLDGKREPINLVPNIPWLFRRNKK